VSREKHTRIGVGHARFSEPIRNERPVVDSEAWPRPTSEVLASSADSTPPRKWPAEGESRVFGPYGVAKGDSIAQAVFIAELFGIA
jgi:hypothetical protein